MSAVGFDKVVTWISFSCYMDLSKLIYVFLQSCHIDVSKLLHIFFPLPNKTKLKLDQEFKAY